MTAKGKGDSSWKGRVILLIIHACTGRSSDKSEENGLLRRPASQSAIFLSSLES